MIMQGCVSLCGTVVFFQKSRNLSRSLLTNNNFYCGLVTQRHSLKAMIIDGVEISYDLNADFSAIYRLPADF